jgi:hypothetical protein
MINLFNQRSGASSKKTDFGKVLTLAILLLFAFSATPKLGLGQSHAVQSTSAPPLAAPQLNSWYFGRDNGFDYVRNNHAPDRSYLKERPALPLSCGAPTISLEAPSINGLSVSVNGVAEPGSGGCTISSISWTWGDGTSNSQFFPATHTYDSYGTYDVNATTHQSDGQTASASEPVTLLNAYSNCTFPSNVEYSNSNYPSSLGYEDYTPVDGSIVFSPSTQSGPSAVSVGVMGGAADIVVSQGGQTLMSASIGGPLNYVVVTGSAAYCYANFDSNGQNLQVTVNSTSGDPLVAFNVYNNYISRYTATLITYPPQFAVNMGPSESTPTNTGISFELVAPTFSLPTPLAIWVQEEFPDSSTVETVQIGIEADFNNNQAVSYFCGLGIFYDNPQSIGCGGISGCNGASAPGPIELTAGDTYNITMALASGTTWESFLNGQCTGEANLGTNVAGGSNAGAGFGLETLTAKGGNVNITNEISIPEMMSLQVDGVWSEPSGFVFNQVGENWYNGQTPASPGIALWGMAGHLQKGTIPKGSLDFADSLPIVLDIPSVGVEPIYGSFSYSQTSSGSGIVNVKEISSTKIRVTPVGNIAYVSIVTYSSNNPSVISSITNELLTAKTTFKLPKSTSVVVVYAENGALTTTSSQAINL